MGRTPKLRIDYVPEGGHRAEDAINAAILLFGLLQILAPEQVEGRPVIDSGNWRARRKETAA